MKYHIPKNQARFTLFSNDAEVYNNGTNLRPRTFEWNIALPSANFSNFTKISIESIFCRNERAVVTGLVSGQIVTLNRLFPGSVYKNNETYSTSSDSGGTGLILTNKQHSGTVQDLMGSQSIVTSRGSGYVVGEIISVFDEDGVLPEGNNLATFEVVTVTNSEFNNHDLTTLDNTAEEGQNFMRMLAVGNQDEKELYSIRCPQLSSPNIYDSRSNNFKNGGSLIYMGKLNLQNTNPLMSYCYDLTNKSFLQGGKIELSLDSNFGAENGISPDMIFGITFVVFDVDETETVAGFVPQQNYMYGKK